MSQDLFLALFLAKSKGGDQQKELTSNLESLGISCALLHFYSNI